MRNRTGDLMSRATNDLNAVRMVLGPGIMYSATTIATMVLAIFFMVKLSPSRSRCGFCFPCRSSRSPSAISARSSTGCPSRFRRPSGVLSTRAQENLTGVRVIRAYVQEKPANRSFDQANREYVDRNIKLIGSWSLFFPALSALIGLTVVILLGMGGVEVIDHRVSSALFGRSTRS